MLTLILPMLRMLMTLYIFFFRIDSLYIESEVLEKIDYEDIIEDFILKNPKE
jgi:hypothetical protein